jgi:hypothetical protein
MIQIGIMAMDGMVQDHHPHRQINQQILYNKLQPLLMYYLKRKRLLSLTEKEKKENR